MLRQTRLAIVHAVLVAFAAALIVRSAWVQLWQGEIWERLASRQHYAQAALPAPRGEILDVAGVPLAQSQMRVRVNIVPQEVREPRRLTRALQRLGVDRTILRRVTDRRRKWVPIRQTFLPSDVAQLRAIKGVRFEPQGGREYAPSDGLRKIVGRTNSAGEGLDGIESMLDSMLRGERGSARALVGPRGQRYESPEALTLPPRPGHTVVLTISYVLQDICDRALADATARLSASGGDIVVVDPRNGEVRCMASRRSAGVATASTALVEPFEPGSTLKPFFAGALLESGRARVDDVVETYDGVYRTHGRTITDVHRAARLSLADVIRHSSNVGIVRFTERLAPREMYEILRDFGFGSPTGVAYPSEAPGILYPTGRWSAQSQASLAIGYEIAVTPLQLAMAYAAIGNGGVLLSPSLIKSVQNPDGEMVYEHRPRAVRRVLQAATARTLREILASVVDSGTSTDAALAAYAFGGKSGTAKRVANGSYGTGRYTSTFVGLFPAREPQYVVLVKIDNPQGSYYGGKTAAPVAKAVIEAAIAARDAGLDRADLALQKARYVPPAEEAPMGRVASAGVVADARSAEPEPSSPYALVDPVAEPAPAPPARFDLRVKLPRPAPNRESVAIPDVRRLPVRVAVRELHRAGLRVRLVTDAGVELAPPPGTVVPRGTLVRLERQ
jgi:cell division protein FtsI (penicillin-binding protein 3)